MRMVVITLASFLLMLAAPISAQDFQKGLQAVQSGDFDTALKRLEPLTDAV